MATEQKLETYQYVPEEGDDTPDGEEGDSGLCTHTFVSEAADLQKAVESLDSLGSELSAKVDWVISTLCKYQEQPHLLDAHLEPFLDALMRDVRTTLYRSASEPELSKDENSLLHTRLKLVYTVAKVRGPKLVAKFLPHEVADIEPALRALLAQDRSDHTTWESRYVLLLWFSHIVMIPFKLSTVDSGTNLTEDGASIIELTIRTAKEYLRDTGRTREAAAMLLARLLTRPDMHGAHGTHLSEFLTWCRDTLAGADVFTSTGIFTAISYIFKLGQRDELLRVVDLIFDSVMAPPESEGSNSMLRRKFSVKVAQRIGLTFLRPRVASWRYQRGARSLLQNLNQAGVTVAGQDDGVSTDPSLVPMPCYGNTMNTSIAGSGAVGTGSGVSATGGAGSSAGHGGGDDDDDFDESEISTQLEDIIDHLLNGLQDKDTVVRWSAAKGIGRITNRLPLEYADDIVEAVLELLAPHADESTSHGACLAIAELARRGLLLPSRLRDVVPLVVSGLQYDVRKGSHSVGGHVRDAACYVAWAFARAYAPEVMGDHVATLAPALITAAVFDREVNCRRAASAAFQENVGRQGNFPHGIEILTAADYFTVGNRNSTYLSVALFIAKFDAYRRYMINHLLNVKLVHWDPYLRPLAAQSLAALAPLDPAACVQAIPMMIELTTSPDLNVRHGNVLGLAEVILALSKSHPQAIPADLHSKIRGVVPTIEKKRLYRGRGGEILRGATARLMECIALSRVPMPEKTAGLFLASIEESIKHPNEDISRASVAAFAAYAELYDHVVTGDNASELITRHINTVDTDPNAAARRGFALALGVLPPRLLDQEGHRERVVDALIRCTHIREEADARDAESRRNAVRALHEVITRGKALQSALSIVQCFHAALTDYSMDNRGDVGSWVREEAMLGLPDVVRALASIQPAQSPVADAVSCVEDVVAALLKQLSEKIDRVRECAGRTLHAIIHDPDCHVLIAAVQDITALKAVITPRIEIDWSSAATTFPLIASFLVLPRYCYHILGGFVVSVGGLTESTQKASSQALISLLTGATADTRLITRVADCILQLARAHAGVSRVIVPLFRTIKEMFDNKILQQVTCDGECTFGLELIQLVRGELKGSKDIVKVMAAVPVVTNLLCYEHEGLRTTVLKSVLLLLGNPAFPKVRAITANMLYMAVMTIDDIVPQGDVDTFTDVLLTTPWDGPIAYVREQRAELYGILDLPLPVLKQVKPKTRPEDEIDSYKDLVKEAGY